MSLVSVKNLTFIPQGACEPALDNISLSLPKGSRTLLIGANGAGKSTLLQILAGKKLIKGADVTIKCLDVFYQFPEGVTFLGTEWAMNPVVRSDIVVSRFLDSVGGYRYKERRDLLLDLLDVDLDWHMHNISDGERRRVQLCMGLMAPWDILLLDEVTVDLDVLVRHELLEFLKQDSEARGATVIYATHIFDGLNDFPTHVAHLRLGAFIQPPAPWDTTDKSRLSLCDIALQWLTEDRAHRRQLELKGRKMRGARRNTPGVPSDSETFYKKYTRPVPY
ncbi:P-loop containing nucleoside triphosphate hydrolase protein [Thelephora ganbajun]|uniref:P-loop containing nucleoside triphosphate hydrolase protein n=1 Tax=Thelephora ganbajun TaxID=370292 RepID=A0ACB6ZQ40_THEGA|nr:P-loop containing nucleoside triphosphate hydrolase protein [Thelephora ganbajun]